MKDTFTQENRQDFHQRYKGVFGWLIKDNEERVLVHITDVQADRVVFKTPTASDYFALSNKGVVFEFLPVTRGFVATNNGVFLLQRHPARQFQRGISDGNTQAYTYGKVICGVPLTIELLSDIFEKKISYRESVEKYLEEKQPFCALSQHFAIAKNNLFFMNRVAGTVEKTTLSPVPLIRQELQDLIARNVWLSPMQLSTT